MLHIFNVNQGQMLALDVASAVGSVHQLQEAVQGYTGVPVHDQVLLVSGGEILDAQRHVSSYHGAGTDSNPLYLVCKVTRGNVSQLSCSADIRELSLCLGGLKEDAQRLTEMATSFECVQRYSSLADRFTMASVSAVQTCSRLVQEQHLLHQGWQALASNLEDTVAAFERRAERFKAQYDKISTIKGRAVDLLRDFDADLDVLAQIPLPSCLVRESPAKSTMASSPKSDRMNSSCTLLEWISASDPDHSLRDVADEVRSLLSQVNEAAVSGIQTSLATVHEQANNREMKEIKGISKRFAQLDHHLRIADELEEKQRKFAELVKSQEHKALKGARDMDTVRELCRIQRDTADQLIDCQQQLTTIADKFAQSKAEVLNNVRARLSGWIVETHQQLHTGSNQLALYAEKLTALKRRLDVIRQVHEAPPIYATAVTEVIRRKALREDFSTWAQALVEKSLSLAKDEGVIRENFSSKLDRHFLRSLFPGMNDKLPEFATENPRNFDQDLPALEADHLRSLRRAVPTLSSLLQVAEPHVYDRLLVRDPRAPVTISPSSFHMRREESFFTAGSPLNMTTFAKSFPSTAWLSGDENLDLSPGCDGLLMAKSPPVTMRVSSVASSSMKNASHLGQVTPLRPLSPPMGFNDSTLSERMERSGGSEATVVAPMSSSLAKSAPIRIPTRDSMTSSRQMSEKSSHFGTPEETFGIGSGDEMLSSPPEVISRSQFREEVGAI
uniref:Autophagy protein ATG17-like domain-containing protein n=1 Tax=Plectus sambesii TaxID=2011161 RepID=A0A914X568_9BILA